MGVGEGGRGEESTDRKKAWSSVNHPILSGESREMDNGKLGD
jgi:hypothetical protein